jgi:hypothetical protein
MNAPPTKAPQREPAAPDREVLRLQRWMQYVITHPRGVAAAMTMSEAKAEFDLVPDELERVVSPARALSGLQRISIYAEMYALRLVEVLHEDFPVLLHALGAKRFDELARAYLVAHPSRHPNLNQLGKHLSGYVAASDAKHAGFLAELARLERVACEAFDAERAPALAQADFERVRAEQWPELRLALVPSARLLAFRYPVNRYYIDVKEGRKARMPKPAASWTLVYRKDWIVWRANLSREQHALLELLAGGATLGAALEACAARADLDLARLQQQLGAWFREWSAEGVFRSLG